MGLKNAFNKMTKAAVQYVLLPTMLIACAGGLTSMKPADPVDTVKENTLKEVNELRLVNEKYQLNKLVIRYDSKTGYYDMQLKGFDNGENTGTKRATQMYLGFSARPGNAENVTGVNAAVILHDVKYKYDPRFNTQADVDVEVTTNYYGNQRSFLTVTPTDDPLADPESSGPFEVKSQRYKGTVILEVTDMQGNPVANPRNVTGPIMNTSSLGTPVYFKQNFVNDRNPRTSEYNFYRTSILGDGQQKGNYFPEKMQMTGAQFD